MNKNFTEEIAIAVLERTIRRLWILCIILVLLLVGTNLAWLYYENQFEDVVTTETNTIDADAKDGGDATGIVGNNNEVNNNGKGESNKDQNNQNKAKENRRQ